MIGLMKQFKELHPDLSNEMELEKMKYNYSVKLKHYLIKF